MSEAKLIKSALLRVNSYNRPNPTLFYFPGITSSSVWDSNQFKSARLLEQSYSFIKEEYVKAKHLNSLKNDYTMIDNEKSLHKGTWNWYSYIQKGKINESFKQQFPLTAQVLGSMDDLLCDVPFSYSFFSHLDSPSEIAHHYGPCNIRLRLHLGIDIPPGKDCKINIEEKSFNWEEGKCILFDDTYIHNVVNSSGSSRTILLVDLWHPEITKNERKAIVEMFKKGEDMVNKKNH